MPQLHHNSINGHRRSRAPGRVKIVRSLSDLLREKDFSTITTAEIARNAGVTEALIYKHFKDKRDMLYQVLIEYLEIYKQRADEDLIGIQGSLNKLRRVIWFHINVYANDRTFARILLLEVRSYTDYYDSAPYRMVKEYSDHVLTIVQEGIASGEIRSDLPPTFLRQAILGSIEHVCLTGIALSREISPEDLTEKLYRFFLGGILKNAEGPPLAELESEAI